MQPDTETTEDVGTESRPDPESEQVPDDVTSDTVEIPEGSDSESDPDEGDTFPRSYVEKLRRESAGYRERASTADTYAQRLHTELVKATGRLADASDIPFDESHLDDPEVLSAAVDELLIRKPHLASRRPVGDIGQGASVSASTVDLAGLLRQRAT